MHDEGGFRHTRAAERPEYLMPEAHAEYRYGWIEQAEKFQAQSGVFRMTRPRGNAYPGKFGMPGEFGQAGIVVFHYHGVLSEAVKGLHQIVGERIVIIDEQKHGCLPRRQARARMMADLLHTSFHSMAGRNRWTMPPPACQQILPSFSHMLRMVMPVSRLTAFLSSPSQPMQPA